MSLSPWDVGSIAASYDFGKPHRPIRRISYQLATHSNKHKSGYRSAVLKSPLGESDKNAQEAEMEPPSSGTSSFTGEDFIDAVLSTSNSNQQKRRMLPEPSVTVTNAPQSLPTSAYVSHKHNITIAINDEPVDRIRMKCRSPSCYQHNNNRQPEDTKCVSSATAYRFNMFVLCVGYITLFSSFRALQNLYTSLYSPRLGAISLCSVYLTTCVSCVLVLPAVHAMGSKRSIQLGFVCYLLWMSANLYPRWYTLVPGSLLAGLGHSVSWNAQVLYMMSVAELYCNANKQESVDVLKYNALFLALFQTTHVWGNAITSLIFTYFQPNASARLLTANSSISLANFSKIDASLQVLQSVGKRCGVMDCAGAMILSGPQQTVVEYNQEVVSLTAIVLLCLSGLGLLTISCFLQKINTEHKRIQLQSSAEIAKCAFEQMCFDPVFRMLIPLLIVNGFEQGLIYSDYNKWYIACAFGIDKIGLHMMVLGIVNVLSSAVVGCTVRFCPREIVIGVNSFLHIGLIIVLIVYVPTQQSWVMFLVSAFWGLCDAAWQTQCNILIATECKSDHRLAFMNFRLLQSFGAFLAFALSTVLCNYLKLYLLIGLLVLSITCYVVLECKIRQRNGTLPEVQHSPVAGAELVEMGYRNNSNNNNNGVQRNNSASNSHCDNLSNHDCESVASNNDPSVLNNTSYGRSEK